MVTFNWSATPASFWHFVDSTQKSLHQWSGIQSTASFPEAYSIPQINITSFDEFCELLVRQLIQCRSRTESIFVTKVWKRIVMECLAGGQKYEPALEDHLSKRYLVASPTREYPACVLAWLTYSPKTKIPSRNCNFLRSADSPCYVLSIPLELYKIHGVFPLHCWELCFISYEILLLRKTFMTHILPQNKTSMVR